MGGVFIPRRGTLCRAALAWLLVYAIALQSILAAITVDHKAQAQSNFSLSAICHPAALDAGGTSDDAGGSGPSDNKPAFDCCGVCALLHAAQSAVPPSSSEPLWWPVKSRRIDFVAQLLLVPASDPTHYRSRAPPQAA